MAVADRKDVDQIVTWIRQLNQEDITELLHGLSDIGVVVEVIKIDHDKLSAPSDDGDYEDWYEDESDYYTIVKESLKEVWDNEEDDIYNDDEV
jgi:hypothetical protein